VCDPGVAEFHEMTDGKERGAFIVERDVSPSGTLAAVQQEPRNIRSVQLLQKRRVHGAGEQKSVDTTFAEHVDVRFVARLRFRLPGDTAGQKQVAQISRSSLRTLYNLGIDRIGKVRNEQPNCVRSRCP
jgi:hypothetical protein